jgi:SanA protein
MKKMLTIGVVIASFILLLVLVIFIVINKESGPYLYNDLKTVPRVQTIVVLGAALLADGNLSSVFKDRVDAAILLYRNKKGEKILVTGDNGTVEHNEVNPVRNYLLDRGIPSGNIFLDHAGFDTYSSIYRAKDIFLVDSAIIVSQTFHVPRAVYIARYLGLLAYGFSADRGTYKLSNYFRECLANIKAVGDLLIHRKPKYLGETIPITGQRGGQ